MLDEKEVYNSLGAVPVPYVDTNTGRSALNEYLERMAHQICAIFGQPSIPSVEDIAFIIDHKKSDLFYIEEAKKLAENGFSMSTWSKAQAIHSLLLKGEA